MSATGRPDADGNAAASDIAARLREAEFVRLVATADGDALAASGVLARGLGDRDCPVQVSVAPLAADADRATEADCTVALGRTDESADASLPGTTRPASETAAAIARELGQEPAHALALAGCVADGRVATTTVAERAREAGIDRRPGVAVPTTDLADGLAHSTLFHAPLSGDPALVRETLGGLDGLDIREGPDASDASDASDARENGAALAEEDHRRVASLVAIETVGVADTPPRAGEAIERLLRPHVGGPFETIGGYADVLDALARAEPGTGVALALGHDVADAAIEVWRSHGHRAHRAVRDATTGRYDGLFVARADRGDAPVGTMARLVHQFRSPEPVTLAVTDGAAAAVADDHNLGPAMHAAATAVDGTAAATQTAVDSVADATGTGSRGRARFETDTAEFIMAFREAQ